MPTVAIYLSDDLYKQTMKKAGSKGSLSKIVQDALKVFLEK